MEEGGCTCPSPIRSVSDSQALPGPQLGQNNRDAGGQRLPSIFSLAAHSCLLNLAHSDQPGEGCLLLLAPDNPSGVGPNFTSPRQLMENANQTPNYVS